MLPGGGSALQTAPAGACLHLIYNEQSREDKLSGPHPVQGQGTQPGWTS